MENHLRVRETVTELEVIEQINKLVNDLGVPEGWKYAIKKHAWELQSLDVQAIALHMKKCEAGLCQRIGHHLEINSNGGTMKNHLWIREAVTELLVECAEHNVPTQVIWLSDQTTYVGTLEYRSRTDTFRLRVEDFSISFQAASVVVLNISEADGLVITVR